MSLLDIAGLFAVQYLLCVAGVYSQFIFTRHVILPPDIAKLVPRTHLMTESEWRNLGVQQSPGWVHFMVHAPGTY